MSKEHTKCSVNMRNSYLGSQRGVLDLSFVGYFTKHHTFLPLEELSPTFGLPFLGIKDTGERGETKPPLYIASL